MAAKIGEAFNIHGDEGIGALRHVEQTVFRSFACGEARKLVHIFAGLEAEMFEGLKLCSLTQDGDVELPAVDYHIMGEIRLVHRNSDPVGLRGHLDSRICDTAVVLSVS